MLRIQALPILPMPCSFFQPNNFSLVTEKLVTNYNAQIEHDNQGNFNEQKGFSFASIEPRRTFTFADDIFDNGQIRPIFPASNQSLLINITPVIATSPLQSSLKKSFDVQTNQISLNRSGVSKEPHNEPSPTTTMAEVEASTVCVKKRQFTRFSKIWRFLWHMNHWKNNNTKETLVFFNPSIQGISNTGNVENVIKKGKSEKRKMKLSAHEKFYVMNRMRKEKNKHRSFLPYRPELVGIFANVNGFSRSLHPTPN